MQPTTMSLPPTCKSPFIDLGEDVFRKLLTHIAGESIDGVVTPHAYRHILPFALCNRHHYIWTLSSIRSLAVLPLSYKRDQPSSSSSSDQTQVAPSTGAGTAAGAGTVDERRRKKQSLTRSKQPKMTPFPTVLLPTPPIIHTTIATSTKTNLPPYHRHYQAKMPTQERRSLTSLSDTSMSSTTNGEHGDEHASQSSGLDVHISTQSSSSSTSFATNNFIETKTSPILWRTTTSRTSIDRSTSVDTTLTLSSATFTTTTAGSSAAAYTYADPRLSDRLPRFTARLQNLRALHLFRNSEVCDAALIQIVRLTAHSLRELRLRAFRTVSDVGIRHVLTLAPALEVLDLSYCHNIRDMVLVDVMRGLRRLRVLHLGYWTLSEASLGRMLQLRNDEHVSHLDMLDLTACSIHPYCSSSMARLYAWIDRCHVDQLKLRSTHLFNTDFATDVGNMGDGGTVHLMTTPCFSSLDLALTRRLTDSHLRTLLSITSGSNTKNQNQDAEAEDDQEQRHHHQQVVTQQTKPHLAQLRTLNVSHCSLLSDETLNMLITHAPKLTKLDLSFCVNVTSFNALAQLTYLQSLNLSGCPTLTNADVAVLSKLPWLSSLSLMRCAGLTDDAVDALVDAAAVIQSQQQQQQQQKRLSIDDHDDTTVIKNRDRDNGCGGGDGSEKPRWDFVDFRKCHSVSNDALTRLYKHCHSLIPVPVAVTEAQQ